MEICFGAGSPDVSEMQHFSNVHTPDFESQLLQNEPCNQVFKSTKFSKKGVSVSTTSGRTSLFNSPETLQSPSLSPCQQPKPYTQQLEETIISKYSAGKEAEGARTYA